MPPSLPGATVACCLLAAATSQQPQWLLDRQVPGDFQGRLAYDEARECVVLFGCVDPTNWLPMPHAFTFEWDGQQWIHRFHEGAQILDTALCYDPVRRRVVRTFGFHGSIPDARTWEWDGQTWTLRPASGVVARARHASVFHAANGSVVTFGGWGPAQSFGLLGDTARLVGSTWTTTTPTISPPARFDHAMAYDTMRQRTVLFGGVSTGTLRNDTWEWDGAAWQPRPTATQPSAREHPALAFDPQRGRIVLFGGRDSGGVRNDTWEWDGTNWQQIVTAHAPLARSEAAMVFDRRAGHMLLFGGRDDAAFVCHTDTWSYDGVDWQLRRGPAGPNRRGAPALVADTTRNRLVLFGGIPDDGGTWESDGRAWQRVQAMPPPLERYQHHAAFDSCRGVTVLFGGRTPLNQLGDTWEWNGAVWTPRPAAPGTGPSPRSGGCMAFDAGRCVTVLFGGQDFQSWYGETWEWNGASWQQRTTVHIPTVANFAMTYDPTLARIVMFGGSDLQGPRSDTWHYDGVDWTLMSASGPGTPPPRHSPAIAFDPQRGRTLLFGGGQFGAMHDDLWEWNGSQWTPWVLPVRPEPQSDVALVFDVTTDRLVATGGWTGQGLADTWVLAPQGPGITTPFGSGCAAGTPPQLRSAEPFLGNDRCPIEIVGAAGLAPVVFVGGHNPANVALPGGCTQFVGQPLVTALRTTNPFGGARCDVYVPMLPALRGVTAVLQAVVFDGTGPYQGTTWTAGLRLTVGD